MIWAVAIFVFVVGIIVTATLLYLHIEDHPDWAMPAESDITDRDNQVAAAVAASIVWPVTLLVVVTIQARAWWLNRDGR